MGRHKPTLEWDQIVLRTLGTLRHLLTPTLLYPEIAMSMVLDVLGLRGLTIWTRGEVPALPR